MGAILVDFICEVRYIPIFQQLKKEHYETTGYWRIWQIDEDLLPNYWYSLE